MLATERRRVREARLRLTTGDRAGALAILRSLEEPKPRSPAPVEQLCLSLVLDARFRCSRLDVDAMRVRDCLERRGRVYPSGGAAGARGGPKGRPVHRECQDCPIGRAHAYAVPGVSLRPPSRAPEVLPLSQRMARRARQLVGLEDGEPVNVDPLREAASLSPDDHSEWSR